MHMISYLSHIYALKTTQFYKTHIASSQTLASRSLNFPQVDESSSEVSPTFLQSKKARWLYSRLLSLNTFKLQNMRTEQNISAIVITRPHCHLTICYISTNREADVVDHESDLTTKEATEVLFRETVWNISPWHILTGPQAQAVRNPQSIFTWSRWPLISGIHDSSFARSCLRSPSAILRIWSSEHQRPLASNCTFEL